METFCTPRLSMHILNVHSQISYGLYGTNATGSVPTRLRKGMETC